MINQLAHKDFFNTPTVKQKFQEVLNGNERQFTASLLSIVNNNNLLARASNTSIMTAAMKAAVLNLPIEPSLGFAYIVPYKQDAQFQLGYKGLIQLAIRSGTLANMHQFGYEVEEEKRYTVKVKGIAEAYNCLNYNTVQKMYSISTTTELGGVYIIKFTRKELEDAGFGWVFDCPGVEVKEVDDGND